MGYLKQYSKRLGIRFKLFAKFYYAFSTLALVILIGTSGYMAIEDWSFLDSFYMTIISITTVGFKEVHELSGAGQIFTAILIISSFGIFAYAASTLTSYLVGGEYKNYIKHYRIMKEIEKLDKHVIICGFGRVGRQAANEMKIHNKKFVVLENNTEIIERYSQTDEFQKVLFIQGDATQDETLVKAGIDRASALIIALPNDSDNLFVVVSSRELNSRLTIISRASKDSSVKKLRLGGANNVIMPDKVGGAHMASLVITPDVMEFLDLIRVSGSSDNNLEEVSFNELKENFSFKTIGDLNAHTITGCNIIGYKEDGEDYIINPSNEIELTPDSKCFVLGTPEQLNRLKEIIRTGKH